MTRTELCTKVIPMTRGKVFPLLTAGLMTVSFAAVPFLGGCAPSYPSSAAVRVASQATHKNASPMFGVGEDSSISCLAGMKKVIGYIHRITEKKNQAVGYMRIHSVENPQYKLEIIELSRVVVQLDQSLLSYCGDTLDRESILSDLVERLTDAERAEDALRVANECYHRFPLNSGCVAASVEAFRKLDRNIEARAAAEKVIRRGPYDAKMEVTIKHMRVLLELINVEEQLRAIQKQSER